MKRTRRRTPLEQVYEFYRRVNKPVRDRPTCDIPSDEMHQILRLLAEETDELKAGFRESDIVAITDALADIAYVVYGAAVQLGVDLDRAFEQVHEANMSKPNADGSVVRARDGKILRGDSYRPPALEDILKADSRHSSEGQL